MHVQRGSQQEMGYSKYLLSSADGHEQIKLNNKLAVAHTLLAFFFRAWMPCSPHHLDIFSQTSFIHSFSEAAI
jgi:hypothetical protein